MASVTKSPQTMQFYARVLSYISDTADLRDNLVLQGGGALCFFYGSCRMTSDLDFVSPRLNRRLTDQLTKGFKSATGVAFQLDEGPDYIVVTYRQESQVMGVVEITEQTANDCIRINNVNMLSGTELLTDKITTLHNRLEKRNLVVETDILYILYLLQKGYFATPKQIREKARQYGYRAWDRQINNRLKEKLSTRKDIDEQTLDQILCIA